MNLDNDSITSGVLDVNRFRVFRVISRIRAVLA